LLNEKEENRCYLETPGVVTLQFRNIGKAGASFENEGIRATASALWDFFHPGV